MYRAAKPTFTPPPDTLVVPPPILARRDNPGGGGTITITTVTSRSRVAPESVRFGVDLGGASFDTAGPSESEVYDARMHELIYLWDFGDAGEWTAPVNVLAEWKKRNVAKGPVVTHLFRSPGRYTVSVLVIEPSSGKTASTQTMVEVGDPDRLYAGPGTICVNPVGDRDFTGAPVGALLMTASVLTKTARAWVSFQGGRPKRWLFKRGASYTVNLWLDGKDTSGITFGAYGDGAAPVINVNGGMNIIEGSFIYFNGTHGGEHGNEPPELRIFGLDIRGTFDPTSESVLDDQIAKALCALAIQSDVDLALYDCILTGFKAASVLLDAVDADAAIPALKIKAHFDNVIVGEMGGGYPFALFNGKHPDSCHSFTGCRIVQNPQAVAGSGGTQSLIRSSSGPNQADGSGTYLYMAGCDFFQTDNRQFAVMAINTPKGDGRTVNVHSCSFEGGNGAISTGSNNIQSINRFSVHNVIIDGCIHVAAFNAQNSFAGSCTGITVRNCLSIVPNVSRGEGSMQNPYDGLYSIDSDASNDAFDQGVVGSAPINVYNNTLRYERNASNQSPEPTGIVHDNMVNQSVAVKESNNLWHAPNLASPFTTYAPVTDTEIFTARTAGMKLTSNYIMNTAYAIPSGSVKETRPLTGSMALGAALTGHVSYMDILLQERPEPPSIGAWEAE